MSSSEQFSWPAPNSTTTHIVPEVERRVLLPSDLILTGACNTPTQAWELFTKPQIMYCASDPLWNWVPDCAPSALPYALQLRQGVNTVHLALVAQS